jgi:hypothetical protein
MLHTRAEIGDVLQIASVVTDVSLHKSVRRPGRKMTVVNSVAAG